MQAIMEDQDVWEVREPIGEAMETQSSAVAAAATTKDMKVRAHLLQCLPDNSLMQVVKKKMGKEVWDCLKERFIGADRVKEARLQMLKSEFDSLRMKDDEQVDQYTSKISATSVKYRNLGRTLYDSAMVKKLFDTVPDRYITMVAGIEQFFDLKKLAFEEVVGQLKAYEERIQQGAGS